MLELPKFSIFLLTRWLHFLYQIFLVSKVSLSFKRNKLPDRDNLAIFSNVQFVILDARTKNEAGLALQEQSHYIFIENFVLVAVTIFLNRFSPGNKWMYFEYLFKYVNHPGFIFLVNFLCFLRSCCYEPSTEPLVCTYFLLPIPEQPKVPTMLSLITSHIGFRNHFSR